MSSQRQQPVTNIVENTRPRRRQRRSAEELRSDLLEHAYDLIVATGTADGLSLEDAVAGIDAARTSAYRLFADDKRTPQEQFRHDVLTHAAARAAADASECAEQTLRNVTDIIGDVEQLSDASTATRTATFMEAVRVAGATMLEGARRPQRRPLLAVTMTHDNTENVARDSDSSHVAITATYRAIADAFNLIERPPYRLNDLAEVAEAMFDGVGIGAGGDAADRTTLAATGPDGELREWTVYAATLEALFAQFLATTERSNINWPRSTQAGTATNTETAQQRRSADRPGTAVGVGEVPRRRATDVSRGSGDAAEEYARQLEAEFGGASTQVADALSVAARSHLIEGNPVRATELFRQNLAIQQKLFGPEHPATLRTRVQLALCALQLPDQTGVATMLEELHTYSTEMLGAKHPVTVEAGTLLATALARQI